MVFVSMFIAPAVVAAASATERRLGPSAGGWVAALPISLAVALAAVAVDAGEASAAAMALSAASHVPAQVLFAAAFVATLPRGALLATAAGVLAYVAGALLLAQVPDTVAIVAAVPLLALATRTMVASPRRPGSAKPWSTTAATCVGAATIVGVAVLATRLAGPTVAGAIAAFPTVSTSLALAVITHDGPAAGSYVLAGMVRSLPCYLTFCLLVAVW